MKMVHNTAFGRERKDMIYDAKTLFPFAWEKPEKVRIQTAEEQKQSLMGMGLKPKKLKR